MIARAALLLAAIALTAGGSVSIAPADRAVRLPDGRTLNFWCAGHGTPTILLEAGWGADSRAWGRVIGPLAARYRVCAEDRAGSGRSDPGPLPRDGAAIARDLDAGLAAAGIGGPLVVVGHSAGGLYVRLFADRRRRDVIGMVLVDSSVPHQPRRFAEISGDPRAGSVQPLIDRGARCLQAADAGIDSTSSPALKSCGSEPAPVRLTLWRTRQSEIETLFTTTSDEVDAASAPSGALPVIALTAGNTYTGPALTFWHSLHQEIAARSSRGTARIVPGSGHMMMFDQPQAIVDAVGEVVKAAGQR